MDDTAVDIRYFQRFPLLLCNLALLVRVHYRLLECVQIPAEPSISAPAWQLEFVESSGWGPR